MNKPMSIKDRIRAMNLEAERSSIHNIGYNKPVTPPSAFTKKKCTEAPSSTQSNTPKSHSSYEEETNAMAINVWRRRKAKDEKQDDEGTDVAEWNLSDLRKGTLAAATTTSSAPITSSVQSVPVTPEEPKEIKMKEKPHQKNSFKNNYIQNLGRTSPIPRSSPITVSSPSWTFRSKLKPITRAPHTLALVQAMTTPPRHVVDNKKECEEKDMEKIQTKWNRNAVSMSPKKLALGSKFQQEGGQKEETNSGNASVSSFSVENVNKGRNALSMSPRKIGSVNLETFEKNADKSVYNRNAVSMSPRRVNAFQSVSLKKVVKKVEEQEKTVQEEVEEMPMDEQMDRSVASITSVSSQTENEMSKADNTFQQDAPQQLVKRTPNRSKISDRIKAFSSAANGQSWKQKQQQSPRYTYPMPPSSIKRHNMQRYAHTNNQEDSSCASSERQSEKDDDSISVLTPMANHTPARLGAQPPTPNSYNSAYTSVASSGDGAVAGSYASHEQNISNQMFYSHMSTPSSSVQGDSNPLNSSNASDVKNAVNISKGDSGVTSPKHGQVVVTIPKQKNTLQSKLENDKQKAFARRARMMNRMQNKMPSELVAAQKKAQDGQVTRKWGVKTPNRDGVDSPSTRGTPGSIDADPTMNEVEVNVNAKKSALNTISKEKQVQVSQVERPNTPTSGKMKAHLMKKLIHKRRQRRNQIHDSNSTTDKPSAPLPSPQVQSGTTKTVAKKEGSSIGDYCIRSRRIDRDLLMKAKSRKEAIVRIPIVKPKATLSEPKEPFPVKEEKENNTQPVVEETVFDESPMKPLMSLKEKEIEKKDDEIKLKEDESTNCDQILPPPPPQMPHQTMPQAQQHDEEDIPPLPPVIIRSTQNTSKDDSLNASSQDIAVNDSSTNIDGEILPMQEVLNDSVSVASSLLNEEEPDDEYEQSFEYEDKDDEPEPIVDSFIVEDDYDEPEPAVDSFITDDLSPIRQNEVSKHALENSASYQNSPSKIESPEQSPEQRPGHIRDLITSQSTPVHANRHASLRNVGEMLFDPQGTPLESSFFEASAPVSPKMKPRITYKEADEMFDTDQQSNDPKTFRNHCADAFSDVSSARSGSTTSATSSAVSNAHKIIAERRAKKNKEFEATIESPKSNISIEEEDDGKKLSIAQDLARKIMSPDVDTSGSSLNDGNRKPLRGKEAIKEALLANRSSDVEASPMRVNQTADTDPASMSPSIDHGKEADDCSDSLEIIDASMDEDNASIDGKNDLKTRVHVIPLSPETNMSMNSTTSDLDMDIDNSIFDQTTLDQSTADQTNLLDDGCQYPKPSFFSKPLTNFSDMVCGQTDDVDTSKEESLNTSTASAVRISHIEEDDDDLPFDETCNEAVEVEYISNDTTTMQNETTMTNVTKSVLDDSSMLMNITKELLRQDGEDHDFSNAHDYTNPNYISESSCDTSLDEIDYQISVYNR